MLRFLDKARVGASSGAARGAVLGLLAVLVLGAAAPAQALPEEFSARYVAKAKGMSLGRADLELKREANGEYHYSSRMKATGLVGLVYRGRIYEDSAGAFADKGVLPSAYDYKRTGPGGREDSIRFGADDREAVVHYKGERSRSVLPEDALDPLSLHLALMRDVAAGEKRMRYLVVEPRRVKAYEVEAQGRERIRTRHGEYQTVRVEVVGEARVEEPAGFDLAGAEIPAIERAEATTFWLAPELDYLVVRIVHRDADDGDAEMDLDELRALETAGRI